jgi:L-threonylcarbamoyladenylate synthase
MDKNIKKAVEVLKKGGVVIFSTDTAFGIGCRIDDKKAVERVFKIRKRPESLATPVLVDSLKMAKDYLLPIPKEVLENLIKPYWPGALTIVLLCKIDKVPSLVRGGGKTLGVRMPNHKVIREVIKALGVPIIGPSANFHGEETPYKLADLNKDLLKEVDFILEGETFLKKASTVIDCSKSPWVITREGAVDVKPLVNIYIDTASQKVEVGLEVYGKKYSYSGQNQKAQVILPLIERALKDHDLDLFSVKKIYVNNKSGSFTGIRVGAAVANMLGVALKVPINDKKVGELVNPLYN